MQFQLKLTTTQHQQTQDHNREPVVLFCLSILYSLFSLFTFNSHLYQTTIVNERSYLRAKTCAYDMSSCHSHVHVCLVIESDAWSSRIWKNFPKDEHTIEELKKFSTEKEIKYRKVIQVQKELLEKKKGWKKLIKNLVKEFIQCGVGDVIVILSVSGWAQLTFTFNEMSSAGILLEDRIIQTNYTAVRAPENHQDQK